MSYKITKQYLNGSETLDTTCKSLDQARLYVDQEAEKQAKLNVIVTFRVYEFDDIQYSVNSKEIMQAGLAEKSADSGSGQSQSSSFRPTPLEVRLRPKGSMPDHYRHDDSDDEVKK